MLVPGSLVPGSPVLVLVVGSLVPSSLVPGALVPVLVVGSLVLVLATGSVVLDMFPMLDPSTMVYSQANRNGVSSRKARIWPI